MSFLQQFRFGARAARSAANPALPALVLLAGAALILTGCAGVVAHDATTKPPSTYDISGTVTPAAGGSGATLTLSGPSAATVTADSSGNYSFTGLANGTYVVTPSHSGYSFSPASQGVTVNGANMAGIDFTATQQTPHSVSLSWVASTSPVSGYNVYRGTTSGGPYTKLNSSLLTNLSYKDTAVVSGNTYYYVSTAVDSTGTESVFSNQATAKIP
ncbi:MAG TPA: carboxypeptidase regulatory-like domain-containing protein [Candidatus Limnocylindrales bacterium]|nr:carboxypeptidase regulatory-like domain-containing protein [Candidatus Limnocylindrales bacterium]